MDKARKLSNAKDRTLERRSAYEENFIVINRTGDKATRQDCISAQYQQIGFGWNDRRREAAAVGSRELTVGGILDALIEETRLELEDLQGKKKDICEKEKTLKNRLDHLTELKSSPGILELIDTKVNGEEK